MKEFVAICFLLILAGCDKSRVYESDRDFSDRTWKVKDNPEFEFEITDTVSLYNIYYRIRNSSDYPYARIFVQYHLQNPAKAELQSKLVSNYLFDQKSGIPLGSSGIGDVFDHQFLLFGKQRFNTLGKYKLKLEQFMRTDSLSGIYATGVRVEKID